MSLDLNADTYIVGWGCLSLIISCLAQGKNRSGFGWWLGGLLLGPVALFFLTIASKLPEEN